MKTRDLVKLLEKNGWKFNYELVVLAKVLGVVRHKDTDEELAKAIIRRRGLK